MNRLTTTLYERGALHICEITGHHPRLCFQHGHRAVALTCPDDIASYRAAVLEEIESSCRMFGEFGGSVVEKETHAALLYLTRAVLR